MPKQDLTALVPYRIYEVTCKPGSRGFMIANYNGFSFFVTDPNGRCGMVLAGRQIERVEFATSPDSLDGLVLAKSYILEASKRVNILPEALREDLESMGFLSDYIRYLDGHRDQNPENAELWQSFWKQLGEEMPFFATVDRVVGTWASGKVAEFAKRLFVE